MFVLALLGWIGTAHAAEVTLGPHMEWWPSAARQQVSPGVAAQFHTDVKWWGVDVELAYARGQERSASVQFTHHFMRTSVLWAIRQGRERIAFQGGIGPALTVHASRMADRDTAYSTLSLTPGVRVRAGLGGDVKRFAWQWYTGFTSADFPRHHYDTGLRFGVNW